MAPQSSFIGGMQQVHCTNEHGAALHLLLMGWVGGDGQITGIGAITPHFVHFKVTQQLGTSNFRNTAKIFSV